MEDYSYIFALNECNPFRFANIKVAESEFK